MKKIMSLSTIFILLIFNLNGCSINKVSEIRSNTKTITIAVAASLKNCIDDEIIPMFKEQYPNINVQGTYDSSGKLQTQIEEGAEIDVFISASSKQMNKLNDNGMISKGSIIELLENKIVLISSKENEKSNINFQDILESENIAVGDPESVPAGQYAKELFENLKIWDKVYEKASLGTNVTQVLNWVAEGSADYGIVYSTDAKSNNNVQVLLEAPKGSVSKVIYPVGIIEASENKEDSENFIDFLQTDEAIKVFESYGFSFNK